MTHAYHRLFGLTIAADAPLPRVPACPPRRPDLLVSHAPRTLSVDSAWQPTGPWSWRLTDATGSWLRLRYALEREWVEFTISPTGEQLWIDTASVSAGDEVGELLLGPVISGVLAQRGVTCLHAAVLRVDGRVIAVIGPKATGKSTLACALLRRGAQLVTDDIAVLGERDGHFTIAPGPRRLRLNRDSAASLGLPFDALPRVWADLPERPAKRYYESPRDFPDDPLPLDAVYLLAPRGGHEVSALEAVNAAQALPVLMAERHMVQLRHRRNTAADFEMLGKLARSVPVALLHRPDALAELDNTVDAIVAHAAHAARTSRAEALR